MDASTPAASCVIDLPRYLARLGFVGSTQPTLETLRALHEAHVGSIPFENLGPLLGKPGLLDSASLQDKMITRRRGGYCFEQNLLFKDVLEILGFEVTGLAARVRLDASTTLPRTHMTLRVGVEGGDYLADVGFGADGLLQPIPLREGEYQFPLRRYRLREDADGAWVLSAAYADDWLDQYAFSLEPQLRVDYEVAHHYTSTHPASRFVRTLTAQLTQRHRRVTLRNHNLTIRTAEGEEQHAIVSAEQATQLLADTFGLMLDPGESLPAHLFQP